MSYQPETTLVETVLKDGVALIALNRPEKRNARLARKKMRTKVKTEPRPPPRPARRAHRGPGAGPARARRAHTLSLIHISEPTRPY